MGKEALKAKLTERFSQALDDSLDAVTVAKDGQLIADCEWQVRGAFAELGRDCLEALIQERIDAQPSENQAAFSPSGGHHPARQRLTRRSRADLGG